MLLEKLEYWEALFVQYLSLIGKDQEDASHDLGHFRRVYRTARYIASIQEAQVDLLVILAAAYFHDIVSLPKNHPDNNMSSRYAALKSKEILNEMHFPEEKIDSVCHAIATHSFSAGLQPETMEAKIIQDADRMEALGALGAMRTFYVSGRLQREPFDRVDMYARNRPLNDKMFGLDHFYQKLFKLPSLLQTKGGALLACKRVEFLKIFVIELERNIQRNSGGALFVVNTCYQAGRTGLKLFDLSNPFAINRPLDPTCFALDQLIAIAEKFSPFLNQFLSQLEEEIS